MQTIEEIERVTAEDVRRVAEAHVDPKKLSLAVVGDRATVEPQLEQLPRGKFLVVDADGKAVMVKSP